MEERFYLYNEKDQKVKKVTRQEYKQNHEARFRNAANEAERKKASMDYFTGIRTGTRAILPQGLEIERKAGEHYQDMLTDAERAKQKKTSGTEIYIKHKNAGRIGEAQKKLNTDIEKRCTTTAKALRVSKEDLRDIGAFFGSSKKENEQLARFWMNRVANPKKMFENVFNAFLRNLQISFDGLDLSTESKLAQNAEKMEKISAQYDLVLRMLSDYRELYDILPEKSRELVDKKMGEANGILNYYRLMRTVITDPYYMTHENRELARSKSDQDTPQQRRLLRQLWLARGGLKAITDYGVKALDDKLDALCGNLSAGVVTEEQLKTRRELSERQEEIEKNGLSGHLNNMSKQKKLYGIRDNDSNKSVFFRARHSVKELALPERVEEAAGSVSGILDQLDFLEAFSREKVTSRSFYLMEHNYRDIAVMEKVESLSGPLKGMKEAILAILRVNEKGLMASPEVSSDAFKEAQTKYQNALQEYREGMKQVQLLNTGFLPPPPEEGMTKLLASADKARKSIRNPKKEASPEQKKITREKLRAMMLKLAENRYSDAFLYQNAKEIMELMKEKQAVLGNSAEFSTINELCFLAQYLYAGRRRKDIAEAKKQNLPVKLKEALEAEDNELKTYVENGKGGDHPALRTARGMQKKDRIQAEKDSYDLADLKAAAAHYMFQEEWAKNSQRKQMSISRKIGHAFFTGLTRFLGWVFSKPKTMQHGEVLYEESRQKLSQLPRGIETFGNEGAGHTISHGDGTYAPPVELNKYFKDPMKITLAKGYNEICLLLKEGVDCPAPVKTAVEALSSYCRVRGIVNRDTFEMEQAFLDKFRISVDNMLVNEDRFVCNNPSLVQTILKTYRDMLSLSNGNLHEQMTKAEYEAAKEQKAVYVMDTYAGDMKESNMRDLPLFPHAPNLNDVKQGTVGDCYLVAATQTILAESPEVIRDMFTDLGNGEVLVRLYASYDEVSNPDGSKEFRRVDNPERMAELDLKPVYVKVKKQYTTGEAHSSDCMWMQLLEVAYAAAGFNNGYAEIKEDGELIDLNRELTDGEADAALMHMTGKKYTTFKPSMMMIHTMEQADIEKSTPGSYLQKHILLDGVKEHLRDPIYRQLKLVKKEAIKTGALINENWERKAIETGVRKGLMEAFKTKHNWEANLESLLNMGKLSKVEKKGLVDKIKENYCTDEKNREELAIDITNRILRNMDKPGNAPAIPPKGFSPLMYIDDYIDTIAKEQQSDQEEQKSVYERILEYIEKKIPARGAPVKAPQEGSVKAIQCSVKNFMTLNPDNRYTQRELGVLQIVRQQTTQGRAMCFDDNSHVRTILDTKYHNGKWFVLVRDPFNVYRNEYTTQGNEVQTKSYGLGSALTEHFTVRNLSTDLKNGFLGTCWYELKDIAKEIRALHYQNDREDDFANSFDDQ